MYFSEEILLGISLACVGIAGVAYLYSRRNDPTTIDDCAEPKIMEKDLEHHFEMYKMRSVALEHHIADAIYTVKQNVDEQLSEVRTKLNRLDETVAGLLRTAETITTANNRRKTRWVQFWPSEDTGPDSRKRSNENQDSGAVIGETGVGRGCRRRCGVDCYKKHLQFTERTKPPTLHLYKL